VELAFAAAFVLIAAGLLLLLPSSRPLVVADAVALTFLYAIASRVEFATGAGSTVPTQLAFVPMLFFLPLAAVPLFVAAGLLLGRLPRYVRGRTPPDRALVELGDALYSIGPVVVLSAAGADLPSLGDWPVYVAALAAQFAIDTGCSTARSWLGFGVPPRLALAELGWICLADALLAAVGLLAASPPWTSRTRTCSSCRCSPCSPSRPATGGCGSSRATSCTAPTAARRCCSTASSPRTTG
jgi:hypothetical protein